MAKNSRQNEILRIISEKEIRTHSELLNELRTAGYNATQATVSRDMTALGVIKAPGKGKAPCYMIPNKNDSEKPDSKILSNMVKSVQSALNTIVIKTYPGMASAAAASIDHTYNNSFLGSIAGDDTIFIIAADEEKARSLKKRISEEIKNDKGEA